MATRAQKVKLGIFLSAAAALFIGTLVVFAGMRLGNKENRYYVLFSESVSGLDVGAPVKVRGVAVGAVVSVKLSPHNVEKVKVAIDVHPGTPIKKDSKAYLMMQGITGLKFIEIRGGTQAAAKLPPDSYITAGESVLAKLTGSAEALSFKSEQVLNNLLALTGEANRDRINGILDNAEKLSGHIDALTVELTEVTADVHLMLAENRGSMRGTLAHVNRITASVADLVGGANRVMAGVDTQVLKRSVEALTMTLNSFRDVLGRTSTLLDQNQGQIRAILYDLRIAADSAKELARSLQRKPSLLFFDGNPKERKLP